MDWIEKYDPDRIERNLSSSRRFSFSALTETPTTFLRTENWIFCFIFSPVQKEQPERSMLDKTNR